MLHVQIFRKDKYFPDEFDCENDVSILEEEFEDYNIDLVVVSLKGEDLNDPE